LVFVGVAQRTGIYYAVPGRAIKAVTGIAHGFRQTNSPDWPFIRVTAFNAFLDWRAGAINRCRAMKSKYYKYRRENQQFYGRSFIQGFFHK
jgi:hypothetical protein